MEPNLAHNYDRPIFSKMSARDSAIAEAGNRRVDFSQMRNGTFPAVGSLDQNDLAAEEAEG
jgi:hypothetical protein